MNRILSPTPRKSLRQERYWFIGVTIILAAFTSVVVLWALLQLSKAEFIFFPIGEILAPIVIVAFIVMFGVFLVCSSIGRRLARRHSWSWKGYVLVYMVSLLVAYSPLEYRIVGGWYYQIKQGKLYETAAKEI
ncbi:MAG: hypothetical protein HYT13_03145 [Candidatus Liptonbacteria bacterium]|nr:hypothetical protein [Candidatus Liptonbacteria bacterium]